jgi:hypothetical protein
LITDTYLQQKNQNKLPFVEFTLRAKTATAQNLPLLQGTNVVHNSMIQKLGTDIYVSIPCLKNTSCFE